MAQHYKNEGITKSRVKVFLGWENFNPKGNVAPGRMDQNLCSRLWTHRTRSAVTLAVASTGKPLSKPTHEYLQSLDYRPAAIDQTFGPTFATHVFRLDITVPDAFHNRPVHLLWDSNSEAMVLSEDAVPRQGLVGGDHWARRADYPLFPDRRDSIAQRGDTLRLYVEIACNGLFGAGRGGDIEPPDMEKFYRLEECCLAVFDPVAWALIHDLTLLSSLAEHLPDSPRRVQALQVANQVVNAVDVADPSTYLDGRKVAAPFLACHNGASQTRVHSVLHSHIDLAWLWPMASTPGKGGRTFATHLRLMELYPECIFVQSQAQLYEWVKERYPNLWDEVCQRVREGRFVPVGATWVEMDCNIPCGESLIRQFVLGQDFFESNFGMRCNEFWLPDTFGYASQLPQIMKGCGVDNFMTIKLSWNLFNKFPHSTFVWEGLDGSRVLAHMPPADTYNSQAFPEEVIRSATKNKDASVINHAMMLVGHGDGGGGASPAMLESMRRMRDLDGIPKVEFSTPARFFEEAKKLQHELPRWVGELYFELHRGTYTSQARTKQCNRYCETLLRDVELLGSQALVLGASAGEAFPYPSALLKQCWKLVLKNCFHDTLPGSSIGLVYEETAIDYNFVMEKCMGLISAALAFASRCVMNMAGGMSQANKRMKTDTGNVLPISPQMNGVISASPAMLLVVRTTVCQEENSLPYILEVSNPRALLAPNCYSQVSRCGAVTTPSRLKGSTEPDEHSLIALRARPGGVGIVSNPDIVTRKELVDTIAPACIAGSQSDDGAEYVLSNSLVKARLSSSGRLISLLLLSSSGEDREALSQTANPDEPGSEGGNRLVIFDDVSQFWCGWDTEVYSFEKRNDVGAAISCEIVEEGPLRVGLRFEYPPTAAGSKIKQYVTLRAESARLDFRTEVDWQESRKILRVLFNTQVRSSQANYNSQFGYVRRPTTFNHSWEIAKFEAVGHQYCDISEHKFGVALLNDCKYGYSVRDSTMRLSLLRAPKSPDDRADLGVHNLTYAILPHWDAFPTRTVLEEAEDLNWPPLLHGVDAEVGTEGELQDVDCTFKVLSNVGRGGLDSVMISAVKQAERQAGHIVMRMYEAMGARGTARLRCPSIMQVKTVRECNMLEDVEQPLSSDITLDVSGSEGAGAELLIPFKPFQIRTVMLQYQ